MPPKKWNTEYSQKLKDPRWQRTRLRIMERDGFECCKCSDTESTLNVHHIKYAASGNPWDVEDHQLVTLCEECHKEEGPLAKQERQTLGCATAGAGWLSGEVNSLSCAIAYMAKTHVLEVVVSAGAFFFENAEFQRGVIKQYFKSLEKRRKLREKKTKNVQQAVH